MDRNNPRSKSDFFYTPNLDRVAAEGMRFSRFYAPAPRCTPSRATYFTGISPAALHMTFVNIKGGTSAAEFDMNLPTSTGNSDQFRSSNPNPKQFDLTAQKGITFLPKNVRAGRPFYLQISHYPGRSALAAKPETVEFMKKRTGNRDPRFLTGAAGALDADTATGQVLAAIRHLGIEDNTYFIYTTDHGTPGRNGLLNSGKGSVYDGGLRVPLIVRGPGIRPNTFADALTTGADLYPTISDLAGITMPLPKAVEGGSLAAVLHGRGQAVVKRPRAEFVVHFPHYDKDPLGPASSIHLGDFKAVHYFERDEWHLYNLRNDLGERDNLAARMPEKLAELRVRMAEYLKAVKAQMPVIDSSRPAGAGAAPRGGQGGNRPSGILTALDGYQDGKVSPAEMLNAAAVLMKFDRDGDGRLTEDEIRRGARGGGGKGGGGKK